MFMGVFGKTTTERVHFNFNQYNTVIYGLLNSFHSCIMHLTALKIFTNQVYVLQF